MQMYRSGQYRLVGPYTLVGASRSVGPSRLVGPSKLVATVFSNLLTISHRYTPSDYTFCLIK